MKSLKNHLSVILSLFVLFFSVEFSITLHDVIQNQSKKLISNYSIVIVSNKKLTLDNLKLKVKEIDFLKPISPKNILDRLKNDMSSKNLALLQIALPYFYSAKLNSLPSKIRLSDIKKTLMSQKEITKVEVFTKTYQNIFQIFQILQIVTYVFSVIIVVISILLLFKQIRIWILEHEEKIKIMGYFGATYWMKSTFLYKLVFVDSIFSSILVTLIFVFLPNNSYVENKLSNLDILLPQFNILKDGGMLFVSSLIFSMLIVTIVSRKMSRK
ncbi:MAG: ABC transporter permease [Epsilonproteobacteria bacterium]|nr:ABC transporter permease [Campylobacterota bacterium]